jgi:tetratricopeptide (TPR) repeat protein
MRILRMLFLLPGIVLCFGSALLWAQEDETPAVKQYREDYDQYQKIQAVKEPLKRAEEQLKFIQERPQSQLLKNVMADYLIYLQELGKQGRWDAMASLSERFIKLQPRVGEIYYYYGQALDSLKKPDPAIDALIKCYLIKNPGSEKAKLYYESIYKRSHQGKTDGLDQVVQKVRNAIGG